MLSRIAESLFWIGRYIERSDGTARILDVHLQLLLEDPWIEEDLACRSLLSVMGSEAPDDAVLTRQDILSILAVDRSEPASIAYSLGGGPRERPPRPRDRLHRALGVPQHDPRAHAAQGLQRQGARVLRLGARALGAGRGHHRVGHEPGRGMAVLHVGSLESAPT